MAGMRSPMSLKESLPEGRHFYSICKNEDGSADVYLHPDICKPSLTASTLLVVRGVQLYEGLEEDIRARYYDWCKSAQKILP